MHRKKVFAVLGIIIIFACVLITLALIKQSQDNRSSAAASDKLETEGGTLSSTGVSKVSDTQTSGGQYVSFVNSTQTPTPTLPPSSSSPIGPQPRISTPLSVGTKFASPTGSGSTCSSSSPCNLITATNNAIAGDIVFLRGGTYPVTANIYFRGNGTASNYITFESYPGEWAILDGSSLATGTGVYIRITGTYNKLRNFEIKNMPQMGLWIGSNHNIVDGLDVHHNKLSGIAIFSPYELFPYGQYGSWNTIQNVKAHDNSDADLGGAGQDYNQGGNADGIAISSGEGNIVKNSIAQHNSDDGIDSWRSTNTHISYSIATANGIDEGNGNGFKAGGAAPSNGTIVDHCLAYDNQSVGFDYNSGVNIIFNNNTSWSNDGPGFYTWTTTKVNNNISSQNSGGNIGGQGIQINNSWQRSGTPAFISTDPSSPSFLKPTIGGGFEDIGAYAN